MLGIGLDFGTTNSTLAVFDGHSVSYVDIDGVARNAAVMPTANYMDVDFTATIGAKALENYLQNNQGRMITLERESLGSIGVTYGETNTYQGNEERGGDTTVAVEVHAMVDKAMPGHLLRGLKRWLGMELIDTIRIFGISYNVVALITPILSHIRKQLYGHIDRDVPTIHIGRPVQFERDARGGNGTAIRKLHQACRYAELPEAIFYPEPLGVAISYLHQYPSQVGDHILTFDFGGGTLDLSVIKRIEGGFDILATHGVPVAGDRINQLIYMHKIFPELGKGLTIKTPGMGRITEELFPFRKFEDGLLQWQQTYTLNRDKYMKVIETTLYYNSRYPEAVEKLMRLRELISWNYSYSVINAIEESKIELSGKDISHIEVDELDLSVAISRSEFESIITEVLDMIEEAVRDVLGMAAIDAERINRVVKSGGSSLIPAVIQKLEHLFPDRINEHNVFQSIAAGLAIANYHQYRFDRIGG